MGYLLGMPQVSPDRSMSLREANQCFARLVKEVEAGVTVTLTRRGSPVATISPVRPGARVLTHEQEEALARTRARAAEKWPIGSGKLDRDALHER